MGRNAGYGDGTLWTIYHVALSLSHVLGHSYMYVLLRFVAVVAVALVVAFPQFHLQEVYVRKISKRIHQQLLLAIFSHSYGGYLNM